MIAEFYGGSIFTETRLAAFAVYLRYFSCRNTSRGVYLNILSWRLGIKPIAVFTESQHCRVEMIPARLSFCPTKKRDISARHVLYT